MKDFFLKNYGLFTYQHLFFTICGFLLVFLFTFLYMKKGKGKEEQIVRYSFWILLVMEIAKIIYHICTNPTAFDNYIPLYFCSLMLFASGLASYGKSKMKRMGENFLVYGAIIAGISYLLFPSTAIGIRPLFHLLTVHGCIYHVIGTSLGMMYLLSPSFQNEGKKDLISYLSFVLFFSLLAYLFNLWKHTNFMFLREPWTVRPLIWIYKLTGIFYPLVIALGQAFGTYFLSYLLYLCIKRKDFRKEQ